MGFLAPKLPRRFDVQLWHLKPRMERIKPLVGHWAESGFGAPWSTYLLHLAKIAAYLSGGILFIQASPGIGSLSDIANWWTEPIVFQKAVIWTLLFEVIGFGCGFGPLTLRFLPPVGGPLYWLRPGTIRLPPWPDKVPLTRGTHRTPVDVLLYLALLAAAVWPLLSPVTVVDAGLFRPVHVLDPNLLIPLAVLVPLVGLRDKTIFLAARAEHTWIALLTLLLPFIDMIVAAKVLTVLIWWGAAASKLNRLFPFTVSVMLSNSPLVPKALKRLLYRQFPRDMRPSVLAKAIAHSGICVEFAIPLVLLVSTDRWLALAAVVTMMLFHLSILTAVPLGVPMEWNVFMLFSLAYLFGAYFPYQPATATHPWALAMLAVPIIALAAWGNMRPDKVSFLVGLRYYAGNWATSMWALQPSAIEKIDQHVVKWGGFAKRQMRRIYGEQVAEVLVHKVLTWRAMHHHGRGLFALLPRAAGAENEDQFVLDGELVAGTLLGWNFGEGHLHNEQLIEALQERCGFEPGEVRVVLLEAHAAGSDRHEYRLVDAATGEFDRGFLMVSDLVSRQPWEVGDVPVYSYNSLTSPAASGEPEDSTVDAA